MDSYWDLYVAYVHHCVEYNKKHDIDPYHYEMEWNHFLPQCLFGDLPFGQYLLLKQHAIASALQTLVFKHNCLCGFHKKHLPTNLLELAWPYYVYHKKQTLGWDPSGHQWCNDGFIEKYLKPGSKLEEGWVLGRLPAKDETRKKCVTSVGRIWVTNVEKTEEKYLFPGEKIPEEWIRGRKKRGPRSQEVRDKIKKSKTGLKMSETAKINMKKAALERESKKRLNKQRGKTN
jgi:hypothetical protein